MVFAICAKTYESKYGLAVAACDKLICGKILKWKGIDFEINPRFYREKLVSKKQFIKLLRKCTSANLVGKSVVKIAIDIGLVNPKQVVKIQGIPHAQVVVMSV